MSDVQEFICMDCGSHILVPGSVSRMENVKYLKCKDCDETMRELK